jgi:hypothetical protein
LSSWLEEERWNTYKTRGTGSSTCHADTQYRIGAQLLFSLRAIQFTHKRIDFLQLGFNIESPCNESWSNGRNDIEDSLIDAFASVGGR